MNKAFEKIIEGMQKIAVERQGNIGMGGELVVNLDDGIDIVQRVASEYNNGWIPCSERLPEPNQKVIVTYMDRYIGGSYGVCEGQYVYILNSWDISDYMSDDDFEVLAWQPLPEPYKDN